jgi:acetyl-CoA acetyltransferase
MAGLKPGDVNMLSLYEAFTITPILFLEDLGYCPKGEGGRFVQSGTIAPAASWRSTPAAAFYRIATPACTACWC